MARLRVCRVVEGQRIPPTLTATVAADVVPLAAVHPSTRLNQIYQKVQDLVKRTTGLPEKFGLRLTEKAVRVKGRQLDSPRITVKHKHTKSEVAEQVGGGVWSLRDKLFYAPTTLNRWVALSLCPLRYLNEYDVNNYVNSMQEALGIVGVQAQKPLFVRVKERDHHEKSPPDDVLRRVVAEAQRSGPIQLVLCIIEKEPQAIYQDLKREAETNLGVMTQCVAMGNAQKAKLMTNLNIALKVNEKLGGYNSIIDPQYMSYFARNKVMVMGADVNHARVGSDRPSFAAVVGSWDKEIRKHMATLRAQSPRLEIIAELQDMTIELLRVYQKRNRYLPGQIIFYRDGVSEGQFKEVLQAEVAAIKAACETIDPKYNPKLTFVVVQKRHNTRFFCTDPQFQDSSGNPPAGLCIDIGVCHPIDYDFFLLSHAGLKGTSKPSYYRVLRNEARMSVDDLQQLSFFLTHNYARCTRAVSMVPAVYYAHLAAKRAQFFLTDEARRSETATVTSEELEEEEEAAMNWAAKLLQVKPPVAESMWFI